MEKRKMTKRQFDVLYERFMPQLYQSAVYLLGDVYAAETLANRVWNETINDRAAAQDTRVFQNRMAKKLVIYGEELSRTTVYQLSSAVGEMKRVSCAPLLILLSQIGFEERVSLILSSVLKLSVNQIADAMRMPEFIVAARLKDAVERMQRLMQLPTPAVAG